MTLKPYTELRAGDTYVTLTVADHPVTVEVLTDPEPWREPFGRAEFQRVWAKRLDTLAEGWVSFGPGGTCLVEP